MEAQIPRCPVCDGLVKPDIVFFGESVRYLAFSSAMCIDLRVAPGSFQSQGSAAEGCRSSHHYGNFLTSATIRLAYAIRP